MTEHLRKDEKQLSEDVVSVQGSDGKSAGRAYLAEYTLPRGSHRFFHIYDVSVDSDNQEEGYGSALFDEIEKRLRVAGHPGVIENALVRPGLADWYERRGWIPLAAHPGWLTYGGATVSAGELNDMVQTIHRIRRVRLRSRENIV